MRVFHYFLALVALGMAILPASAALDVEAGRDEGAQSDERVRLFGDLLQATKALAPFVVEDERAVYVQLAALATRLRGDTGRFKQLHREEVLQLQGKLAVREKAVRKHLDWAQHCHQQALTYAERYRGMAKGFVRPDNTDWTNLPSIIRDLHEMGKRSLRDAQSQEESAKHFAKETAKLTTEVNARERVSRLLDALAKEVPSAPKKSPPARKKAP